jgi:hypothetical protein
MSAFDFSGFPALWPEGASEEDITHDNLVRARQDALAKVTDAHDSHLRELFHLDRFGDMVILNALSSWKAHALETARLRSSHSKARQFGSFRKGAPTSTIC